MNRSFSHIFEITLWWRKTLIFRDEFCENSNCQRGLFQWLFVCIEVGSMLKAPQNGLFRNETFISIHERFRLFIFLLYFSYPMAGTGNEANRAKLKLLLYLKSFGGGVFPLVFWWKWIAENVARIYGDGGSGEIFHSHRRHLYDFSFDGNFTFHRLAMHRPHTYMH